MQIILNGNKVSISSSTNIKDLLTVNNYDSTLVAVEINLEVIPRSKHDSHYLKEDDKIEIIKAVGGG